MKKLAIAAVVVGMIGLIALTAVFGFGLSRAFAQGPTPRATPGPFGYGGMMGWMYGDGLGADWHAQMQSVVAKSLGMSVDDLNAQLRQGKTIAQIAQSKEVSLTKLRDDVLAAEQAFVQQAVKDGRLTQAQADAIVQHMSAMANYWGANGGGCPGWTGTAGYGFGPGGMMGGFGGTGATAPGVTNGTWRGGMMGGFRGSMMGGYGPWATPTPTK